MFKIRDLETFVRDSGEGSECVLLMHGWGGSSNSLLGLAHDLECHYRVINIDLWGFGQSQTPPPFTNIFDYADMVMELLDALGIDSIHVIGHSFGGRIAMILANKNRGRIKSLVLIDSAGLKPKLSRKRERQIAEYKKMKEKVAKGELEEFMLKKYGSSDYQALDDGMRKIFVSVVNQDLTSEAKDIKIPTLILWGKQDKDTPPYMARRLHKFIHGSSLQWLDGGHFAYLFQQDKVLSSIYQFWEAL